MQDNLLKLNLLVEPQEPGKGRDQLIAKLKVASIPKEFIPGVEKGIETISDGWNFSWFSND